MVVWVSMYLRLEPISNIDCDCLGNMNLENTTWPNKFVLKRTISEDVFLLNNSRIFSTLIPSDSLLLKSYETSTEVLLKLKNENPISPKSGWVLDSAYGFTVQHLQFQIFEKKWQSHRYQKQAPFPLFPLCSFHKCRCMEACSPKNNLIDIGMSDRNFIDLPNNTVWLFFFIFQGGCFYSTSRVRSSTDGILLKSTPFFSKMFRIWFCPIVNKMSNVFNLQFSG